MEGSAKTPVHLWIVGALATVWNAFGAFDYLMTQTRNDALSRQFHRSAARLFRELPGLDGGDLGVRRLGRARRRAAAAGAQPLGGDRLRGVAGRPRDQHRLSICPERAAGGHDDTGEMMAMNVVIWAIAIGLLFYAMRMRGSGVLR